MRSDVACRELIRLVREQSLLSSCSELLGWDEDTYMPSGGVENRADQHALLAGLLHERAAAPRVGELLADLERSALMRETDSLAVANIRAIRRHYDRSTR